jgi:nucleoside-diphosphate-sugar epimerase
MKILIIGGTRNLGHFLVQALADHTLTVLNRGITPDELPPQIERLRADRTQPDELRRVLAGRSFDAVIDTTLYKGPDAETIIDLLHDRVGQYVFVSSGQVYLVREGLTRPFKEDDYEGPLMPALTSDSRDYNDWLYGADKRACEDNFRRAWTERGFPSTILRLPMVNSERDHSLRLYQYILRLTDGGSIIAPATPNYAIKHIYGMDVVRAIVQMITGRLGVGMAYNLSQDETVSLDEFLALLGEIMGVQPRLVSVSRDLLESKGLLPDCSPFSGRWMSELGNMRSQQDLGIRYTPLAEYLARIVAHYQEHPPRTPESYRRRAEELALADIHNP